MSKMLQENYARKYYRIQLPAQIVVCGEEFNVVDWSLGGFKCACPDGILTDGWRGDVMFILPLPDMNISFSTQVELRYSREGYAGFAFIDLSENSKAILQKYFQATVEGKIDDGKGLVNSIESAVVPFESAVDLGAAELDEFKQTFRKRASTYFGVGMLLVVIILGTLYSNLTHAVSVDGSVFGLVVNVASGQDGFVKLIAVKEGQFVKKNQLLYSMDAEQTRRGVEQVRYSYEMAKQQLKMLHTQLEDENKAVGLYLNAAQRDVSVLVYNVAAAKAEKNFAEKELERAKVLVKRKAVSVSYVDKKEQEYSSLKAVFAKFQDELKHARINATSAASGKYFTDGAVRGELEKIRARIVVQERNVALHQVKLKQAIENEQRLHVKSSVEGRVYAIKQAQGSFVKSGQSVLSLVDVNTVPWVVASFTFEEAKRLTVGDEADLFIPSLKKTVKGVINTIGDNAVNRQELAFRNISNAPQAVPVKITFNEGVKLVPGTRVEVSVVTSLF